MRMLIIAILLLVAGGGYWYTTTRPGPAEQAGEALDTAIDKTKRILEIVKE